MAAALSQDEPSPRRQPELTRDDGIPGNRLQVSAVSPEASSKPIVLSPLCGREKLRFLFTQVWQMSPNPAFGDLVLSLSFSSGQFLRLQAQLIHLILSGVLLVVSSSEILV